MSARAKRARTRNGRYVVIPEAGDLTAWEAAARLSNRSDEAKQVVAGIAHLIRRAVIVDSAKPGDELWIDYDELARLP